MGGVVRLTAAEFHAGNDGSLEFACRVPAGALAAGQDPDEGSAHLLVGQGINDGVGARVEHGQHQEVLSSEENVAGLHLAAHVQQEQDEEGRPAGDEDAQDDDHGLEQRQRLLRAAAGLRHVLAEGQAAAPSPNQGVDPAVEDDDGQQEQSEHCGAEEDIVLVVERQDGGAVVERADAVPAHDGQAAQDEGDDPAGADQQEGAEAVTPVVEFHFQHRDIALDGDGEEAEHGGRQRHKHTPFPQKPLGGGELVGGGTRQEQVGCVGHSCQQI